MAQQLANRVLAHPGACKVPARSFTRARAYKNDRLGVECMWYPGATPPPWCDGSLPADYGFDPFALGREPDALRWFGEAELYNGRVAMMATAGVLLTDATGVADWWTAGAKADSPLSLNALVVIELLAFAVFEYKRFENYKKAGTTGLLGWAPFDPLNVDSDAMRVREVKNGRLAMLSFLGYIIQTFVTGKGPIECLKLHLENPIRNNIMTSWLAPGMISYLAILCVIPLMMEFKMWSEADPNEPEPDNYFTDRKYKTEILWGLWPAPLLLIVFYVQINSGIEAYRAAGLWPIQYD